jgi:uncharacterized protein with HEPN domain
MSETTRRLSEDLKATRPDVEWAKIAAFRNVLVHGYLGIDLERIWDIVQNDVPKLKTAIVEMLKGIP